MAKQNTVASAIPVAPNLRLQGDERKHEMSRNRKRGILTFVAILLRGFAALLVHSSLCDAAAAIWQCSIQHLVERHSHANSFITSPWLARFVRSLYRDAGHLSFPILAKTQIDHQLTTRKFSSRTRSPHHSAARATHYAPRTFAPDNSSTSDVGITEPCNSVHDRNTDTGLFEYSQQR